ncbi:MAG: CPBP family intramembrane metalloprotease [Candidatus Heimdallarchaeota archaeon]|nr:MAG: CPBP family intramembrane metalloprotease [Candidatus Heimdallarchaeota archaeon]
MSYQVKSIIFLISIFGITAYFIFGGTIDTGETALSISAFIGICATIIQAGSEEVVFHGYFQFRAIDWLNEKKGILLTSAIFSVIHFPMLLAVGMDIPSILFFFVMVFITDIPVGYLTHKTHNLTGAILLHTVANVF